ncbi:MULTISPECIES: Sec-independent protein translocase protein TatB [unclassified Campylobacter]|uniref:Sec-independent protein translocase protein TatB n=1 Tax=unclassified Campylobacter TaxID=2593542 RepID=UPI001237E7B1|nr:MULTISPECIES: Sec-independent protein translocase protein TatB [unclassified Campylobacter]KAA6226726.1 Sec-independent protein translocase subunit TatB [Campylobacter sp. LR196d]KAA6228678.1 Sec-independent protein translocase subunit TatB [Campylobacter sp. LR185c]KAA6229081.1 Sec-independent protein translocase subunit TatB [Campylobacter sp. LR286c]KAA6230163.1 Sec-independent protein translocase subunit TatB [Campylobacter sp. LR291e]KAA6233684.1 Sec-independent protein translocase sub
MSMGEILVIIVIGILILGPEKLPETIIQLAKIWKALKRNVDEAKSSIEKEIRINELKEETRKFQDEFSQANENIRKKLSFEEFDDLKRDIANNVKVDLTFDSRKESNNIDEVKPLDKLENENLKDEKLASLNDEVKKD